MTTFDTQDDFVRMLSRHANALYAYILSLSGSWNDADDIFQETNVVLLRKWRDFEPGTDFLAWACATARYEVLTHRKQQQRIDLMGPEAIEAMSAVAIELSGKSDQRRDALMDCLEQMADSDKRIIRWRYYDKFTVKEIAGRLGVSCDSIYRSLATAHRLLGRCVERTLRTQGI